MARILMNSAEFAIDELSPSSGGTVTRDTVVKSHTAGRCSIKFDSTGSNSLAFLGYSLTVGASKTYYVRMNAQFSNVPSTSIFVLFALGNTPGTNGAGITAASDGAGGIALTGAGATRNGILADSTTWYRLELKLVVNASSQITDVEFRINGDTVGIQSGLTSPITSSVTMGFFAAPGANVVMHGDDLSMNDSSGAANNTWLGEGYCIGVVPTSDSQRGTWTGGVGGTTNLFDAVNNTPPIGTASETDLTQIESVDTAGNTAANEYRGGCGTYLAIGLPATVTVNALMAIVNNGEDVATGTKTGSFGLQANPSQTYTTFNYGNDAGALGTYPSNWLWVTGTIVDAPSVTLSSALIVAIRKTDSGSRVASCDCLGVYIDFTPARSDPGDALIQRRRPSRRGVICRRS